MTKHATIIRYNAGLDEADAKIVELLDRYKNVNLSDKTQWANTSFAFARQLHNMLHLARVIVQGARLRDESRGAHYKPDFPDRNDAQFLKTTMATFNPTANAPAFSYAEVDTSPHPTPPPQVRRLGLTIPPHTHAEATTEGHGFSRAATAPPK